MGYFAVCLVDSARKSNFTMSLTPQKQPWENNLPPGQKTPGTLATELSNLDLPAPEALASSTPSKQSTKSQAGKKDANITEQLSHLNLPEPEALQAARQHRRRESVSEEMSERLSRMALPQPERIFGPDDVLPSQGKEGVSAEDWDKVKLGEGQDVPEAVRRGSIDMTSRHRSHG